MNIAVIEINSCLQCPHFLKGPTESTDDFDSGNDWSCNKVINPKTGKPKTIACFVEWHEINKTHIPDWCPILKQSNK